MKKISLTEFKKLSATEIEKGPCLQVTGDGKTLFYAVVNPQQVMKDRIEANCNLIDAGRTFNKDV